ncbi:hypothetical protein EJ04DRAFT_568561 [Polyplosphaeria fusca]|uniref:Uncharacterized protein n=1 Tax=Polyplosphaeria fusca TaxID=682080 RepID=A0A9P4QR53_9PLEO|nr:hypothetical protein EJ04DRAFT_568561 [Polyplosphaeria fusca]
MRFFKIAPLLAAAVFAAKPWNPVDGQFYQIDCLNFNESNKVLTDNAVLRQNGQEDNVGIWLAKPAAMSNPPFAFNLVAVGNNHYKVIQKDTGKKLYYVPAANSVVPDAPWPFQLASDCAAAPEGWYGDSWVVKDMAGTLVALGSLPVLGLEGAGTNGSFEDSADEFSVLREDFPRCYMAGDHCDGYSLVINCRTTTSLCQGIRDHRVYLHLFEYND